MEIAVKNYKRVFGMFACVVIGSSLFTQCASIQTKALQEVEYQDTIKVPVKYRPSTLAKQQQSQLQRQQTPQQSKDFQEIMALVRKADKKLDQFDNISKIQDAMLMMNQNMILMQSRYRTVSIEKDSMLKAIRSDNSKMYEYLVGETTRRKQAEIKEAESKKNSAIIQVWNDRIVLWCLIGIIGLNLLNLLYKSQSRKQLKVT